MEVGLCFDYLHDMSQAKIEHSHYGTRRALRAGLAFQVKHHVPIHEHPSNYGHSALSLKPRIPEP